MFRQVPVSSIAACFGMAAFAVAIISGLGAGQAADAILWRAIQCLAVCYPLGLVIGMVCRTAVDDHLRVYIESNPEPEIEAVTLKPGDGSKETP